MSDFNVCRLAFSGEVSAPPEPDAYLFEALHFHAVAADVRHFDKRESRELTAIAEAFESVHRRLSWAFGVHAS